MLLSLIPSYGRTKWLVNEWMPAYSERILEPMCGKIGALVLIQNPSYGEVLAAELSACRYPYLHVDYVWDYTNPTIGKVRATAIDRALELFEDVEYIWMQDDDTYPVQGLEITDHLNKLVHILKPDQTLVLHPGSEFEVGDLKIDLNLRETIPSYLRGHIYHSDSLKALDRVKFSLLRNGEDYALPRVLNKPIVSVRCLESIMHLCSNSLFEIDVLSDTYQSENKSTYQTVWNELASKYDFDTNGFQMPLNPDTFRRYHEIWPEYFEKDGTYKAL